MNQTASYNNRFDSYLEKISPAEQLVARFIQDNREEAPIHMLSTAERAYCRTGVGKASFDAIATRPVMLKGSLS